MPSLLTAIIALDLIGEHLSDIRQQHIRNWYTFPECPHLFWGLARQKMPSVCLGAHYLAAAGHLEPLGSAPVSLHFRHLNLLSRIVDLRLAIAN